MKRAHYEQLYKFCASAAIVLFLLVIMGIWRLGSNSMIACGFLGAFFFQVSVGPRVKELLITFAVAAGYGLVYALLPAKFGGNLIQTVTGLGAFLGLGSLTFMSISMIWSSSRVYVAPFRRAAVLPIFSLIAGVSMDAVTRTAPPAYDFYLYAFDNSLGLTPGASLARLFDLLPWLGMAASATYALLLIFPTLYDAWGMRRGSPNNLMKSFVVSGVCGFTFYQVCPGLGPLYVFGARFPAHLPALGQFDLVLYHGAGARNAMPSMHMTWALLVWWSAWELTPLARVIASAFVALTFLSTVGSGEHYLVDLIVAVPLVLLVEAICCFPKGRKTAIGAGIVSLSLTLAWLAMLRTPAVVHLPLYASWAMVVATIGITVPVQFALKRRVRDRATLQPSTEGSRISVSQLPVALPESVNSD